MRYRHEKMGYREEENEVPRREKGGTETRKWGTEKRKMRYREEEKGVPRRGKGGIEKRKMGCIEEKLYIGATVLLNKLPLCATRVASIVK